MASKSISQLNMAYSLSDNDLFLVSKELGSTFVTYKIPYKFLNNKLTKSGVEAVLTGEINTHSHAWANISGKPVFAPVATTGSYSDLLNRPSLSAVAFSGSYADLTNKPTLFSGSYADLTNKPTLFSGSYNDLLNRPSLSSVAFSGSYNDLLNKPTLFSGSYSDLLNKPTLFSGSYNDLLNKPTFKTINGNSLVGNGDIVLAQNNAQVNSDWNATSGVAMILNKPKLATVATTGSYADLTNKPTLFSGSYNDLTNKPTLFSGSYNDLTNKPTLFSGSYNDLLNRPSLSAVAFSGSYADLTNKPTFKTINGNSLVGNGDIVLAQNNAQVNSDWNATSGVAMILNKPNLATVAKTGSYNDLSNKPTIPTVGNATITFKQGGVTKGSFNANQTTDVTINLDATTQSGTVSSSDILNTVLTGLDGFQSSGAVVATDSILKAIRKLRDQIAVLTAPPNYGSVSDVGGEGYYPFAVSDGVLYTTSQTITMQPGFYRFVCANTQGAIVSDAFTYVQRKITGEYLARATNMGGMGGTDTSSTPNISTSGVNAAFKGQNNSNGVPSYDPVGAALGIFGKDTFLKYLFNGILDIVKPERFATVMVSHIVHIIEPTEVYLYMGVTNSSAMIGKSIIWIREVPAPTT